MNLYPCKTGKPEMRGRILDYKIRSNENSDIYRFEKMKFFPKNYFHIILRLLNNYF